MKSHEKRFVWMLAGGIAAVFLFVASGSLAYFLDSAPETLCTNQQWNASQNC